MHEKYLAFSTARNADLCIEFSSQPIPHVELVRSNLVLLIDAAGSRGNSRGLFALPVDGRPLVRLDEKWDLPNREIGSFTVVSNQVYLGLHGYLVKCDLESNKTEVLASSRRADKHSELDNGALFQTRFMFRDAKRGRIIVTTERGQRTEFWSLNPAGGQLTLLDSRPGQYSIDCIENQSGADLVFFSSPFCVEAFHLDTMKLEGICSYGSVRQRDASLLLGFWEDQAWLVGPHFIHDGYLWSGGAFGRMALADKKVEQFPPVSAPDPEATPVKRWPFFNNVPFCFEPIANSRNLLLGTAAGAWLIPLR